MKEGTLRGKPHIPLGAPGGALHLLDDRVQFDLFGELTMRRIFDRLYHALGYSLEGLAHAVRHEAPFQYECVVFLGICLFLPFSTPVWGVALMGAWLCVMILELVNSAVEKAFDLIDSHFRPEIKAGKDMLSAAVFLMICFNVMLWGIYAFTHF